LVAYDPSALGAGASVVRAAKLLPEPALRRGDSVYLVGLSRSLQATSRKSIITNPCTAVNIGSADCPRYRAINMEVIELDTDFGSAFSGILTDEQGRVQALWASFSTQVSLHYSCFALACFLSNDACTFSGTFIQKKKRKNKTPSYTEG
jgi:hypothetical protein